MVFGAEDLHRRERRSFHVAIAFGLAVLVLMIAVGWSLYADINQTQSIGDIRIETSACKVDPNGEVCRTAHANSVLFTTPEEACFILAQGGIKCRKPLKGADRVAADLRRSVEVGPSSELFEIIGDDNIAPAPPAEAQDAPEPRAPVPSPGPEPRPVLPVSPTAPEPSPEPAPPAQPAKQVPVVDLPDQLGLCVNALGISVVC